MSTNLQLCQSLRQEVGIAGTGPSTVTNQTGELKRVVDWVSQAYTSIQDRRPNWRWLRSSFTVDTTANDGQYAYGDCTDSIAAATIDRFARWYPHTFRCYLTSAGVGTQTRLAFMEWEEFRELWLIGSPTSSYPAFVSIDPQNNIRLGPAPNGIYTVTGDYQKASQSLALDADTPEMPTRFHKLVVFEAMQDYAAYHGAQEVYAIGRSKAARMMRDLEIDQLPQFGLGDPLA